MGKAGGNRARPVSRAIATLAVVLVAVSGLVLMSNAQATDGVTCTAGPSSITMSWTGETTVYQYTAYVKDSSNQEISQILAWRSGSGTASVTFSSLALDTYTVRVVKQTNDGSWIQFGEQSCTVSTAAATPTPAPTPSSVSTSGSGTIGCSGSSSSITVTLDPHTGTISWEVFVEHSTGYPRVGQLTSRPWSQAQLDILNNDDPDDDAEVLAQGPQGDLSLSTTFTGLAQGSWTVSGYATISGQTDRSTLASISCIVAATPTPTPEVVQAGDVGGL